MTDDGWERHCDATDGSWCGIRHVTVEHCAVCSEELLSSEHIFCDECKPRNDVLATCGCRACWKSDDSPFVRPLDTMTALEVSQAMSKLMTELRRRERVLAEEHERAERAVENTTAHLASVERDLRAVRAVIGESQKPMGEKT